MANQPISGNDLARFSGPQTFMRLPEAETPAGLEVMEQYKRAAVAAKRIAGWIREQGWEAEPLTGPMTSADSRIQLPSEQKIV